MKLMLDHTQRLNLHALLGAQRTDVGSIRAIWAVQDKIALSADEERSIELRRELIGGHEHLVWNSALALPRKGIDFDNSEIARMRTAIEAWNNYSANGDRGWLEPLIDALANPEMAR